MSGKRISFLGAEVYGERELLRKMAKYGKTVPDMVGIGLMVAAEELMKEANTRAPIQTGKLRSSAYVTDPMRAARAVVVEAGYGALHAPAVHERSEAAYRTGMPKWLERTADEWAGRKAMDVIVNVVERNLERGYRTQKTLPSMPSKG